MILLSSLLLNWKFLLCPDPTVRASCQVSGVCAFLCDFRHPSFWLQADHLESGREQEEEIGKLVSMPKGSCPVSFGAVVITGLKDQISKLSKEVLTWSELCLTKEKDETWGRRFCWVLLGCSPPENSAVTLGMSFWGSYKGTGRWVHLIPYGYLVKENQLIVKDVISKRQIRNKKHTVTQTW